MATPASVMVRVQSVDGKFLGDDIGGAVITVRDARTGRLLAEGATRGNNGELRETWAPGAQFVKALTAGQAPTPVWLVPGPETAAFTAMLDLERPTVLEIAAYGPLAGLQSAARVTSELAIAPGQHVRDVVLRAQGLVVQVQSPPTHLRLDDPAGTIRLSANVTLMCGCPISTSAFAPFAVPLWPPSELDVIGMIRRVGDNLYTRMRLAHVPGVPSLFSAAIAASQPGDYEGTIFARQAATGNTGMGRVAWTVPSSG